MFQCYESFRTPKVGRTSNNLYLQLKWDLTDYENHRFNVKTAKSCIDNGAPLTYSHLYYRPKKLQLELERFCTIQRNNKYLMEKVSRIQREGAWVDNKNYHDIKSLNVWKRQKEMIELAYNNQTMINRLLDCTSYYNRSKLEDGYLLNQKYRANIQNFPKDFRHILLQIKLLQKFIRRKVISQRTGKYQPGLERRKNKWALEKEAFEIEKAQKAAQEAIETEEEERVAQDQRLIEAKKFRKRKKEYTEASKKWREAKEERLRLAKQHEKEAKELESEEKHRASEKLHQRREKAKKELEEWKRQKKVREAEREALEKKKEELKFRTERRKLLEQRRARQSKPGTKKPDSEEDKKSQFPDETLKRRSGDYKPSKDDRKMTIKRQEQLEDEEIKMLEEAELERPGLRTERQKSSKEADVVEWSIDIRDSKDDKRSHILDRSQVKGAELKPKGSRSVEEEIEEPEFDSDSQNLTDDDMLQISESHEKESTYFEDERKKPLKEETLEGSENEDLQMPEGSNEEMVRLGRVSKESLTKKEETKSKEVLEEQEDEREKTDIKPDKRNLLEKIIEKHKSETDRNELTEEERQKISDEIEQYIPIPNIPRDSVKDRNQKFSKTSETRLDKAEKRKEVSDNNGEGSKGKQGSKKDEDTKSKETNDTYSEGKKSEDKKSSENKELLVKAEEKEEEPKTPAEEEIEEDLGKVHIMTEEGEIEEIDLGEVKVESEREALRELIDVEESEETENPKLTAEEALKDVETSHVMTDEGKVDEINLAKMKAESEVEGLRDPSDLEETEEKAGEDIKEMGSVHVISDKGILEKIDVEELEDETEREDLGKPIEKTDTQKKDIKESGSAYVISHKGTLEKIDLEELEDESESEVLQKSFEEIYTQEAKQGAELSEEEDSESEVITTRTIHVFGERGSVEEIKLDDMLEQKRLKKTKETQQSDDEKSDDEKDTEEESKE